MPLSEADTSGKFIIPKLQAAGWDNDPHSIVGQRSITDGRIIPAGKGFIRRPPRRVDRSGPTREVRYYEHSLPEGRKNDTKTQPLRYEAFEPCLAWWQKREENDRAWRVPAEELLAANCNLDRKNPRTKNDLVHRPPEELVASILEKEQRIVEIVEWIKALLEKPV